MSAEQSRSPESVVREIRRKTRRNFTPLEKIRIVLEGLKVDTVAKNSNLGRDTIRC